LGEDVQVLRGAAAPRFGEDAMDVYAQAVTPEPMEILGTRRFSSIMGWSKVP
jgi:hypothetical protein